MANFGIGALVLAETWAGACSCSRWWRPERIAGHTTNGQYTATPRLAKINWGEARTGRRLERVPASAVQPARRRARFHRVIAEHDALLGTKGGFPSPLTVPADGTLAGAGADKSHVAVEWRLWNGSGQTKNVSGIPSGRRWL